MTSTSRVLLVSWVYAAAAAALNLVVARTAGAPPWAEFASSVATGGLLGLPVGLHVNLLLQEVLPAWRQAPGRCTALLAYEAGVLVKRPGFWWYADPVMAAAVGVTLFGTPHLAMFAAATVAWAAHVAARRRLLRWLREEGFPAPGGQGARVTVRRVPGGVVYGIDWPEWWDEWRYNAVMPAVLAGVHAAAEVGVDRIDRPNRPAANAAV